MNNNKRLGYKNEMKDFKMSIFFFLSMLVVSTIGHFLEAPDAPYIFTFGIVVFFSLIMFFINLKNYLTYQKNQKIKMYGRRIDGYINSFEYGVTKGKHMRAEYRLVITYVNPVDGRHIVYVTPVVDFDAISDLGSRKCSVYLLDNDTYVTDYISRHMEQSYVWDENIVREYNPNTLVKKESMESLKVIGVFFLIIVLFLIVFGMILV